jgi:hypothetical protein
MRHREEVAAGVWLWTLGRETLITWCPLADPPEPAGRPVANEKPLNVFGEFDL